MQKKKAVELFNIHNFIYCYFKSKLNTFFKHMNDFDQFLLLIMLLNWILKTTGIIPWIDVGLQFRESTVRFLQ
jgi:hypothetical protein